MAQTKLANLVNPQVMADMISANLPQKVKFSPLARIDSTLVGQAGDTVTIPKFAYIGDADDLTEGVAMGTVALTASTQSAQIKQAGKGVEITDKAVLAGYGDPVGEAEGQLELAIASKIDADFVEALKGATLTLTGAEGEAISYESIVDAIDIFEEEDDEPKILFVHPKQVTQLRKDPEFITNVEGAYMTGTVGMIAGAEVVKSKRVPTDGSTYTNFIVKPNALALYLKREAQVETDRDIKAKTTILTADAFYAVAIEDESRVVKFATLA